MKHLFNLPQSNENVFMFSNSTTGLTAAAKQATWRKPQKAKFIYIFLQAAGGGGGPGNGGGAGTQRGGGGGGASGVSFRAMVPAHLVPDLLHIDIGAGGVGVSGVANGTDGGGIYVSFPVRYGTSDETVCYALGGGGGSRGTGTGGGTGGSTGAATNFSGWSALFNGNSDGGVNGVSGSATTNGSDAASTAALCGAGAGGGGCVSGNSNGGNVTGNTSLYHPVPQIDYAAVGAADGNPGFMQFQPFVGTGGSGGAAQNNGAGSPGGTASPIGSGGGGGGAGTTGGAGGKGGGGFALIISF